MSTLIVGYARTPFSKFTGAFASIPATTLGAHAITAALARAGVAPDEVQQVLGGHVLQAGTGQNPARQAAVEAGIPFSTPGMTLNAVCPSSMEAVAWGSRLIDAGEADIVVAFGQESMSLAPHAYLGSRAGTKYGAIEMIDTMQVDGLTDAAEKRSMGASTDARNDALGIDRESQDAWAAGSHARLAASREFLAGEIEPLAITDRKGVRIVADDDGLRADTTVESLAGLRPAFGDGTITAGNSSQLTDGAAAVVLMSERLAAERGVRGIARVVSHAFVAGPDVSLHAQPSDAIAAALAKAGRATAELGAVEINEAFAAVAVHSVRQLGVTGDIVNAHGGAIALGHPLGASGARIVGHLARRLEALGSGSLGAAGICGGGGQGAAILLEAV
ncbi:acetyl-CoA C-acetyltransferase [Conyzicola lurida]|uniref:Probable acetyl-CoA acetyltransferase n=1 Tax=Conyzicola lurida TaxID=1172621 RepID=A0A841ARX9_9MICO|nr:acetyl-CoA C-acyltransferase [Conyzicola lurida]MBB5844325.1 acetyl-CoA C-acetyltransferase [Conyzicola lurida]